MGVGEVRNRIQAAVAGDGQISGTEAQGIRSAAGATPDKASRAAITDTFRHGQVRDSAAARTLVTALVAPQPPAPTRPMTMGDVFRPTPNRASGADGNNVALYSPPGYVDQAFDNTFGLASRLYMYATGARVATDYGRQHSLAPPPVR
jgi:hypothetical protein